MKQLNNQTPHQQTQMNKSRRFVITKDNEQCPSCLGTKRMIPINNGSQYTEKCSKCGNKF